MENKMHHHHGEECNCGCEEHRHAKEVCHCGCKEHAHTH